MDTRDNNKLKEALRNIVEAAKKDPGKFADEGMPTDLFIAGDLKAQIGRVHFENGLPKFDIIFTSSTEVQKVLTDFQTAKPSMYARNTLFSKPAPVVDRPAATPTTPTPEAGKNTPQSGKT